jgi:WD40 repeat protein
VAELLEDGPTIEDDPLRSMATDLSSPHLIVTGSYSGRVCVWDWRMAEQKWTPEFSDQLSCLAIAKTAARSFLAAGDFNGYLFIYDLSLGQRLREPIQAGERIEALTAFVMDGEPYCAVAVGLKHEGEYIPIPYRGYVIRIWNLDTGGEYETHLRDEDSKRLRGSSQHSEWALTLPSKYLREKGINCVAVDYLKDEPVVVAGGPHGEIYKWNLRTLKTTRTDYQSMTNYVQSLTTGEVLGQKNVLFGLDNGALNLMDLASGEILRSIPDAHENGIKAVAIMEIEAQPRLLSGGADGVIKVWSPDLKELYRIEIEDSVVGVAPLTDDRIAVAASRGLINLKLHC